MSRRRGCRLLPVLAITLLCGACSDAEPRVADASPSAPATPASCTVPAPIETPKGTPEDLPWLPDVDLTKAEVRKQFIILEGYSVRSVTDLFEDARGALEERGLDVVNTDFEGFEAELYFAKKLDLAGIVSLRQDLCNGYVKVNVIYDPLSTRAGRDAVKKTRQMSGEG